MNSEFIDKPVEARASELPDMEKLRSYLVDQQITQGELLEIQQFPGGYSNLTFLLRTSLQEMILRKPPRGANIKTAHDMGREFRVLQALQQVFPAVPRAIILCEDESIIGAPFYLMERVEGVILRNRLPKGMFVSSATMKQLSEAAVDLLAKLHDIDLQSTGLIQMGKPEGYIHRQVKGWSERYLKSATDEIPDMILVAEWLAGNEPADEAVSFIHNDFKYDNLVLSPDDLTAIKAVLDWEMATVGSPLMDLGTTLAYWAEATDSPVLKPFNLTWLEGNLNREQVLMHYAAQRNISAEGFLFFYVFGCFKIAVIVQQIYARYKKGLTTDPRFAGLIEVVKAMAANGRQAIQYNRISNFY
jgi:aminoglycoside phosphotransferase (APT) family kinase protein